MGGAKRRNRAMLKWWMLCCFLLTIFVKIGSSSTTAQVQQQNQNIQDICNVPGCSCGVKVVAPWKNVTCILNSAQEMTVEPYQIPEQVVEIFISGGRRIILNGNSFSHLPGLSLLHIDGTSKIVMDKKSFYNLTRPSLLIQISNCDRVEIKTGAFESVQSSIEVEIAKCISVVIENSAFNRLSRADFKDIRQLVLATKTFEFTNQANIGKHGPVTTISFDNVRIPKLPRQVFFTSLAEIKFRNSLIQKVDSEAFFANEISAISIISSGIDTIKEGAFMGKTLIYSFMISNCTITTIGTKAVMAAFANLTVQHSRITEIQSGAINSTTVANVEIVGNEIGYLRPSALIFHNWNVIVMEQNLIRNLQANFLIAPSANSLGERLVFKGNDVFNLDAGALSFVSDMDARILVFQGNFFNQTCHCSIDDWVKDLIYINDSSKIKQVTDTSFCTVTDFLSKCLELPAGVINIRNFTELVCNSSIVNCTAYNGETKVVNTSSKMLFEETSDREGFSWITFIIASVVILVLAVIATFTVLAIRGSRWLKSKGYFRRIHYTTQNEPSNEEEITIETADDDNDKTIDISEDLTLDMLQDLSKMLDDPNTHQDATDMIEQLYQKYIREGAYGENNNQQQQQQQEEDNTHLYEELGNLNNDQASAAAEAGARLQQNDSRSILKIMEEKFNLNFENETSVADRSGEGSSRPLVGDDYSEPSDATVHLYSELKQNGKSGERNSSSNKDSLKSTRSSEAMALRPLPDKPGTSKMQD